MQPHELRDVAPPGGGRSSLHMLERQHTVSVLVFLDILTFFYSVSKSQQTFSFRPLKMFDHRHSAVKASRLKSILNNFLSFHFTLTLTCSLSFHYFFPCSLLIYLFPYYLLTKSYFLSN